MNSRTRNALAVAAVALAMGAAGCTDLTTEPKSTVTEANIFNDPSSYRAFIAKVYAGLAVTGQQGAAGNGDIKEGDEGFSQYLRLYWEAEELPTDEAIIGWNDTGLPELNTQMWSANNGFLVQMYKRVFFQISMANEFLRQTTDEKLSARGVSPDLVNTIHGYRAEARFLRALSYWHGIDLFGSIPFTTDANSLGSTPPEQASRTDIYNFIVSELNEIKPELQPMGPNMYGRATKTAAAMLLAKVYMNAGVYTGTAHYGDAITQLTEVINTPGLALDNNYRDLFMADNNTSPEIIYAIPFDGVHTQTWGGMTFLIHASIGWNDGMNASNYGVDGGWGGIRLKPEAYNKFADGDVRGSHFVTTNHTVAIADWSEFRNGIAAPKYSNKTTLGAPGSDRTHPDTDFPMFRLADAYLMYAEAVLRGGGGSAATALQYVNQLRQRAFGDATHNYTAAQLTGQAGLDLILDERLRELLWEGHRRTDLIRYGKFTGNSYIWAWKGGTAAGTSTDSFRDLYPLPGNELIANPNLTQNPGYSN